MTDFDTAAPVTAPCPPPRLRPLCTASSGRCQRLWGAGGGAARRLGCGVRAAFRLSLSAAPRRRLHPSPQRLEEGNGLRFFFFFFFFLWERRTAKPFSTHAFIYSYYLQLLLLLLLFLRLPLEKNDSRCPARQGGPTPCPNLSAFPPLLNPLPIFTPGTASPRSPGPKRSSGADIEILQRCPRRLQQPNERTASHRPRRPPGIPRSDPSCTAVFCSAGR